MDTGNDRRPDRAAELRRMKLKATSLLVAATTIYLVAKFSEAHNGQSWLSWVRAAAEAGMVGGLADWFAVTALFRRPLGLPIPHTALIPVKKDQIGDGLANFVGSNFLSETVIRSKVKNFDAASKFGNLLTRPEIAKGMADESSKLFLWLLDADSDGGLSRTIVTAVTKFVKGLDLSTPLGQALEDAVAKGAHNSLMDSIYCNIGDYLTDNKDEIKDLIKAANGLRSIPFLGKKVNSEVYDGLLAFINECSEDVDHPFRLFIDQWLVLLANDLQNKKSVRSKIEKLMDEVVERNDFELWVSDKWLEIKDSFRSSIQDPGGEFNSELQNLIQKCGNLILDKPTYQKFINDSAENIAVYAVVNYGTEIAGVISETISKWDTATAANEIELQVGKDLQWIRINGTVVGALAGIVIYALGQVVAS